MQISTLTTVLLLLATPGLAAPTRRKCKSNTPSTIPNGPPPVYSQNSGISAAPIPSGNTGIVPPYNVASAVPSGNLNPVLPVDASASGGVLTGTAPVGPPVGVATGTAPVGAYGVPTGTAPVGPPVVVSGTAPVGPYGVATGVATGAATGTAPVGPPVGVATGAASVGPSSNTDLTADTTGPTPDAGATSGLTRKAGISSGMGIDLFKSKLGWYYDWTPNPPAVDGLVAVPMLWGDGHLGGEEQDAERLAAFQALSTSPAPQFVMGFEEPDCAGGGGSAGISDPASAASTWDREFGRFKEAGSKLISPSMCKQADEEYLTPFDQAAQVDFDIVNLHINKNSREGIMKDIEHYATYGKPMWVSEFACVDDQNGFTPCSDDGQIAQYINDIVEIMEGDSRIIAYAFSNGIGLGDKWRLTNDDGSQLSAAGQVYLDAISKY